MIPVIDTLQEQADGGCQLSTCANSFRSPLKPAELEVLRNQYEKEGEYVGVQTKFNYAWVCFAISMLAWLC
jgi:hypothetical protein